MMKVSGKILSNIGNKLQKLEEQTKKAQIAAVARATLLVHSFAVKEIQENHGGTSATRYNPKRVVMVSEEGDAPNTDTGRLVQSIKFDFLKSGLIGQVGSNLKYAAWLEFGTRIMKARPWLSTALKKSERAVADIFTEEVKNHLKKVSK